MDLDDLLPWPLPSYHRGVRPNGIELGEAEGLRLLYRQSQPRIAVGVARNREWYRILGNDELSAANRVIQHLHIDIAVQLCQFADLGNRPFPQAAGEEACWGVSSTCR